MVAGESAAPAAVEMRQRGEGKAVGAAGESAAAASFSIAHIEYRIAGGKAAGGRRMKKRRTSSGGSGIEAGTSMKGFHGWIGMKSMKRVLKIVVSILSILQPSETASIWVFSEVDDELLRVRVMMALRSWTRCGTSECSRRQRSSVQFNALGAVWVRAARSGQFFIIYCFSIFYNKEKNSKNFVISCNRTQNLRDEKNQSYRHAIYILFDLAVALLSLLYIFYIFLDTKSKSNNFRFY
jgi:hypothetical protein